MMVALMIGAAGGYLFAQRGVSEARVRSDRQRRVDYRQIEAFITLGQQLTLRAPLPPMRGYAISPDFAVILLDLIRDHRPTHIWELGCGVSTLVGAYALEQYHPEGRITSLEHQAAFAKFTREQVNKHGLGAFATVVDAPLIPLGGLRRWRGDWYDRAAIVTDAPIELLVIDGPPQYRNPRRLARYPALPVLFDRLATGAFVLVDDADRRDERRAVKRWMREFRLTEIRHYDTEKGTVLLRKE